MFVSKKYCVRTYCAPRETMSHSEHRHRFYISSKRDEKWAPCKSYCLCSAVEMGFLTSDAFTVNSISLCHGQHYWKAVIAPEGNHDTASLKALIARRGFR